MSHIPRYDQDLAAIEEIMRKNPDANMSFTIFNADPRDVPEGYTQKESGGSIWFKKEVMGHSDITIFIDADFIEKSSATLKQIKSSIQR